MQAVELKASGRTLIPKCLVATTFVPRFLGLMGRKGLGADEALAFPGCNSIHTFFMRFPIDVVFVAADGNVVEVIERLYPWRMLMPRFKAKHVIELQPGRAGELGIRSGVKLDLSGVTA